jgi:chitodextrinase
VASYRIYVNGAQSATTELLSATVSNLTCGSAYLFEVDALDFEGNNSTRAAMTGSTAACPDTQPPSAPPNVAATSRTATSIALGWWASSDNVGVTGYGLYRSGVQVGTSATTTGIFSGLTCNTNYTLAVDAYDAAGNKSSKTTVMVATTACPDTTPPSVPTGLAVSNVTQTSMNLTWNASSDNVGVTGYDVYRNATKMATVTSVSSSQSGLSCGTAYAYGVRALDAAGNVSGQAQLSATTSACSAPVSTQPAYMAEQFNASLPGIWGVTPSGAIPSLINTVSNGEGGSAARLVVTPTSGGPNASSEMAALDLYNSKYLVHAARGEETWYRLRIRFPSGKYFPTTGQWNWHVAWHNDDHTASYGSYSSELGVYTDYPAVAGQVGSNPRLALRVAGGLSSSVTYESYTLPANSLQYDHWYDIVFRIVWGTDQDGTGRIGWWVDGTQIVNNSFPMLQRNPDGTVDHPSFGIYNYRMHDPSHTSEVHFDSVLIGPSAASVGFTP